MSAQGQERVNNVKNYVPINNVENYVPIKHDLKDKLPKFRSFLMIKARN